MSSQWATGTWLIPIINLWKPFMIVKSIYANMKLIYMKKKNVDTSEVKIVLFYFWWLLFIIGSSLFTIFLLLIFWENSIFTYNTSRFINTYNFDVYFTFIGHIIILPIILLTIRIIHNVSLYYEGISSDN